MISSGSEALSAKLFSRPVENFLAGEAWALSKRTRSGLLVKPSIKGRAMKVGDIVKIFAASLHPPGIIISSHKKSSEVLLVFWNNELHWLAKSNLEAIR